MAILRFTDREFIVLDRSDNQEISLAAWREGARPEAGRFALSIPNDEDVEALADVIGNFSTVILELPNFNDGRAYSQAYLIRTRLGFKGELLARGDVLCDQALFLARSGFNALDIGDGDVEAFRRALASYSCFYQSAADNAAPVYRLRGRKAAAA